MDLGAVRNEYMQGGLVRNELSADPFSQFETWFNQAMHSEVMEVSAMQLATVSLQGAPALRTVLLKSFDEQGFVFYTNYGSQKAEHIEHNPRVTALFFWKELERQVEISGTAVRVPTTESLKYFLSRPRGSQLGAWVSAQSSAISSRGFLEQKLGEMKRKFGDGEIPLPDFWGGYRIVPETVEFWQGRANRLHDRFEYRLRTKKDWEIARLSP
uniref:Pyridoxine/pyridoxamine 5'-phosphate oxidase n=1 Tax=uncultured Thiotrichaceae bacterium TaxID=298394 RepID=A0A6S6UCG2_9GAMM|nr:MAG: Pyridoxamine 5'-phosphate oxidase (EC [uncultured Thiotrichaceae bacterium]